MGRARARAVLAGLALLASGCASILLPPPGTADRAERLLEQGRASEAAAAAAAVPRKSPDYARAQQVAARAAALRARMFREALARGTDLEAAGRYHEAIALYEQALVADPRHAAIAARLAQARLAQEAERERRRFAAERAESAVRAEVERAWQAVVEVDPRDREARRRVAELSAARAAQAAVHLERARTLLEDGRAREALEEAELSARLDPSRPVAGQLVARLREREGLADVRPRQPAAAETRETPKDEGRAEPRQARRPLEPGPTRPPEAAPPPAQIPDEAAARESLAVMRAAVQRGDLVQARAALARAETLAPRLPEVAGERVTLSRLVEAEVQERIKRGIAQFQLEDLDGAIAEWGRALELDPGNTVALDYRRKAQGMLKRIEEIREESRREGGTRSGTP